MKQYKNLLPNVGVFFMLNNFNKEAKFDCSTGNNHICCPVAANEINKWSKKTGRKWKKDFKATKVSFMI